MSDRVHSRRDILGSPCISPSISALGIVVLGQINDVKAGLAVLVVGKEGQ